MWIQAGRLQARRLDVERRELVGDPVMLADPVASAPANSNSNNKGAFSVSANGMVAYRGGQVAERRQLAWFDRAGKAVGTLGPPDDNDLRWPRVSPDGSRVAISRTVQGNTDIWLRDGRMEPVHV